MVVILLYSDIVIQDNALINRTGATHMNVRSPRQSYIVGVGIGVLSWLVFAIVNAPIGITTALSEASGAVAMPLLGKDVVATNSYWAKTIPAWDYGTLFLVGTFLGALISAIVAKQFKLEWVPSVWRERFGPRVLPRMIGAFIGGAIAMFGARLAGGCTSGHGISGSLQLAVSSWVFFVVIFISGIISARLIFTSQTNISK